jgi:hydroxymethylbilane synthase
VKNVVRIGTRTSPLARAQANIVSYLLSSKFSNLQVEIIAIKTQGDKSQDFSSAQSNLKADFTENIDALLLDGGIDIAVHSLKDLPTKLKPGLILGATPTRGDPRDALICDVNVDLENLKPGARIGTSSLRRKVQIKHLRKDIEIVDIRGNIETRVTKMSRMMLDGLVLAACAFDRISIPGIQITRLPVDQVIPAAGQGIIAIEVRKEDYQTLETISSINDERTWAEAVCERAFVERLGGDCNTPIAVHSKVQNGTSSVIGMIASRDGTQMVKGKLDSTGDPARLGNLLADQLLSDGGKKILEVEAT